jgi:hypothetical protein
VASYAAIAGTCEAVVRVLRSSFDPTAFNGAVLDFQVYVSEDFRTPMDQGVSLLLYRVYANGAHRTPSGRMRPDGRRQQTKLPIDLHFLLTAWAKKASLQHEIAGWMMRMMEDNPILPASVLNAYRTDVFHPEEAVELSLTELTVEDLFRIWEVMVGHVYQLSVPYVARMVEIESTVPLSGTELVQERVMDYHEVLND